MIRTTLKIDGMMCGMCEAHINDAVRKALPGAKKLSSSHTRGETVFFTDEMPDEQTIRAAIAATGYELKGMRSEPWEKKGFHLFK